MSDKLLDLGIFKCECCDYRTEDSSDLAEIDDWTQRIFEGELVPAGQCPECGALIGCPDSLIPMHTIDACIEAARARGWIVTVVKKP